MINNINYFFIFKIEYNLNSLLKTKYKSKYKSKLKIENTIIIYKNVTFNSTMCKCYCIVILF